MNQIASKNDRLFVDRPVTSQPEETGRISSLRLICQDTTDYTEAAVRLFLTLCILVSLLLCGMRVSATSGARPTAPVQDSAMTAACLKAAQPKAHTDTRVL